MNHPQKKLPWLMAGWLLSITIIASAEFKPPECLKCDHESPPKQPLYFFLFTHTEDPFNHELSEERYLRLIPEVEARAAAHPDAHLTWTIMFQGTDARAITERNPQTGVVDLLRDAADTGVVEFGYHAHHEATYLNRPQVDFTEDTSWTELVEGMVDWLGCMKDVVYGGCIASEGGGIQAVEENLGPVQVVSGSYLLADTAYESGPASHAARKLLPERLLGFGYPDHGPFGQEDKREKVAALMQRLTPDHRTSSTLFWADNVIKMNGGSPMDGTRGIDPLKGPVFAASMLEGLDRQRPNIILTGLASKYLYTKQIPQNSPTIYGYAHPQNPELPQELLNTPEEKERYYQQSLATLDYLLDEVLPGNPNSRFVSSKEVINMVAPEAYWEVSPRQLLRMTRWGLKNWDSRPPDWVTDGSNYYSLRDWFVLLTMALNDPARYVFSAGTGTDSQPNTLHLPMAYGPLKTSSADQPQEISRKNLENIIRQLDFENLNESSWQTEPEIMIQATYQSSTGPVTSAQLLYGIGTLYESMSRGAVVENILLPAMDSMPVTYDLLTTIGCLNTCSGTAWSFKPAVLTKF
ncbi:hypothetical protein [Thiolapillus brandeum]|uniref:Uncharacterized protein n=1 Tax=Thiolapillus brandeum TaxID=1076588 RepID=A0A7U6JG82_9GAMM|nr:hypothetical protein [Thiolapillus brandeum]BAO43311.1 hypothetical protein TBH_C0365 [Thiolapillus brandeum]